MIYSDILYDKRASLDHGLESFSLVKKSVVLAD
jgi:hypothetical protein